MSRRTNGLAAQSKEPEVPKLRGLKAHAIFLQLRVFFATLAS